MKIPEDINRIILDFFTEDATFEDVQKMEEWLSESPENRKLFNDLKEIWLASDLSEKISEFDVEAAIMRFNKRISYFKKPVAAKGLYRKVLQYAAIFLLIVALPLSYYFGAESNELAEAVTTISAPEGNVTSVLLPDSSRVILNSKSSLTFSSNFQKDIRQVELSGEAYFDVQKDSDRPFEVKTRAMTVHVLGTEFNLRAYADEEFVSTTLVEGKIKAIGKKQSVIIQPNQKVIADTKNQQLQVELVADVEREIEWKNNWLVFNNETLEELEERLEKWFNIEITFMDEMVKTRRFTGALKRNQVLEAFTYFGNSKYVDCKIKDREIIFSSQN